MGESSTGRASDPAPFVEAGFGRAELVRAARNGRTRNPHVLAAEVTAVRQRDRSTLQLLPASAMDPRPRRQGTSGAG